MFGLFKKSINKTEPELNFDSIGVDMHSHVLPGIDDGAATVQDSIELIKAMMGVGIKKIIATPHIMYDYYRNTPETIHNALAILKAELASQEIDIPVEASAEYFFDEHFIALVESGNILPINGKYVLIEFSFVSPPPVFIPTIQKLKSAGLQPILAHPERYPYYKIDEYRNVRDWGCFLQVNTISLTGYYGKDVKRIAEELFEHDLVDFISSDMHHPRHAEALKHSLQMPYLKSLLRNYPFKNNLLY